MNRARPTWLLAATIWILGAPALNAQSPVAAEADADARVLALLNSYEVGTTTYYAFSLDFDLSSEAITKSRLGERNPPTSGRIGIIEWKDYVQNRIIKGPDTWVLAAAIMAARDSGEISPDINPYMLGTFLFGYPNDRTERFMYTMTPEKFTIVAQLKFLDGVLVEKRLTPEPAGQP